MLQGDWLQASGNPGLLEFYTPFLSAIYEKDTTSRLAIFGHSHLGHTPDIGESETPPSCYKLVAQIESILEEFDAVHHQFTDAKIVVIGHSVGSWLSIQVSSLRLEIFWATHSAKLQALKSRPHAITAVFLLFPTISHIARTPNGKRLSVSSRSTRI